MGNVMAYSGLVTKVRAMQAKLLTDQDFENIAALHSVPEAVEYLKGKPAYADALNRMDDTLYHRGNVEKVLYGSGYIEDTLCSRVLYKIVSICGHETEAVHERLLETV